MKQYIYADNAATTQMDPDALNSMMPYLSSEYGNASQPYSFSRQPRKAVQEARNIIASCIGAFPEEVFFTSGGTESDNWVIKGTALSDMNKGTIITSAFEHHAILHSCAAVERLRYPVIYLQPDQCGQITPQILADSINCNPHLVSVMFVNNEIGSIQPIEELSKIAHSHNALFHTDAVQAVGHIPINVKSLDVDMLSASAHKFNGPKGIGFLYVRKGVEMFPYVDGGAQEYAMRAGTENIASIVGMAVALKKNNDYIYKNMEKVKDLENHLLHDLRNIGSTFIRNGGDKTLPGLLSLSFEGYEGEAILHRLDLMGIGISTGSACNGKSTEVSHVLKAIGIRDSLAKGTVRISLGKNNTHDDVEAIVKGLNKILHEI